MAWIARHIRALVRGMRDFEEEYPDSLRKKDDDALPVARRKVEPAQEPEGDAVVRLADPQTGTMMKHHWEDLPSDIQAYYIQKGQSAVLNSSGVESLQGELAEAVEEDSGSDPDSSGEFEDYLYYEDEEEEEEGGEDEEDEEDVFDTEKGEMGLVDLIRTDPDQRCRVATDFFNGTPSKNGEYTFRDMVFGISFVEKVCFVPEASLLVPLIQATYSEEEYQEMRKKSKDTEGYLMAFESTEMVHFFRGFYEELKETFGETFRFDEIKDEFSQIREQISAKNGFSCSTPQQKNHDLPPPVTASLQVETPRELSPVTSFFPGTPSSTEPPPAFHSAPMGLTPVPFSSHPPAQNQKNEM